MVVTPFSSIFTEITKGEMTMKYFQTKSNPMQRKSPVFEKKKSKTNKKIPNYFETFENIRKDSISISILFSHDFA